MDCIYYKPKHLLRKRKKYEGMHKNAYKPHMAFLIFMYEYVQDSTNMYKVLRICTRFYEYKPNFEGRMCECGYKCCYRIFYHIHETYSHQCSTYKLPFNFNVVFFHHSNQFLIIFTYCSSPVFFRIRIFG